MSRLEKFIREFMQFVCWTLWEHESTGEKTYTIVGTWDDGKTNALFNMHDASLHAHRTNGNNWLHSRKRFFSYALLSEERGMWVESIVPTHLSICLLHDTRFAQTNGKSVVCRALAFRITTDPVAQRLV